jgi:hypothetical protein
MKRFIATVLALLVLATLVPTAPALATAGSYDLGLGTCRELISEAKDDIDVSVCHGGTVRTGLVKVYKAWTKVPVAMPKGITTSWIWNEQCHNVRSVIGTIKRFCFETRFLHVSWGPNWS